MGLQRGERRARKGRTAGARGGGIVRLYTDENVAAEIVAELRRRGHDTLTSYEAGNANLRVPDEEVLAFAARTGRIVVTGNRKHFIRLHRAGDPHAGVLVFTERYDPVATAGRIDAALNDDRARGRFLARVDGVSHTFDP